MTTVVLLGTLDTKGGEYGHVRDELRARGVEVTLVDTGILGEPEIEPDITKWEVADAADADLEAVREREDQSEGLDVMSEGAAAVTTELYENGELDGVMAMGGSGNTTIGTTAMKALPVTVPKLMVSTLASGDTSEFVNGTDITMMYSVFDIAGLNSILKQILSNAAGAMAGMAQTDVAVGETEGPVVGLTQFGVTTPAANAAREWLEDRGYEVLVFHATGAGGQSLETMVGDGLVTGVLDLTLTELADNLIGGIHAAGPDRLTTAAELGVPQVVSLGALDMADFGPIDSVPSQYEDRNLYEARPAVTVMRTTPEECRQIGEVIAEKLNQSNGPCELFIPLQGLSMWSVDGEVFHEPEADEALFDAIRENVDPDVVTLHEHDTHINDPEFAVAMAKRLHELHSE